MIDDDMPLGIGSGFKDAPGSATPLTLLGKEDLDPYSVEDLRLRIATLEGEIRRASAAIESKQNRRSAADALFSFKGN